MGAIFGILLSLILAKWSYNILYVSKNKFWGRLEFQNFYDCNYPVFDTYKQVRIWNQTFRWRVLLEIEPLVYDPKPTPFQKDFYLQVVERFDELFIQAIPSLHQCFGEIKPTIVNFRETVQPLLVIVPLSEQKEWRIYCVTSDNLAFTLYFKGYQFEYVEKFDKVKMEESESKKEV